LFEASSPTTRPVKQIQEVVAVEIVSEDEQSGKRHDNETGLVYVFIN